MTKKSKIIVVSICASIIVIGVIIGIIFATRKMFDITPNATINYVKHTNMKIMELEQGYNTTTQPYSNGTTVIVNTSNQKSGVFSYIENRTIIPAVYDSIEPISIVDINGDKTNCDIFRAISDWGEVAYFSDEGERLNFTKFDESTATNYGFFKQREMSVEEKRHGVKVKTDDDYDTIRVEISSIQFMKAFKGQNYYYEIWKLTDTNGNEYDNLYDVNEGERELIQTLNNSIGNSITSELLYQTLDLQNNIFSSDSSNIYFLTDGTPMFCNVRLSQTNPDGSQVVSISIYDVYYNQEDSIRIDINSNLNQIFGAGNNLYFQYLIPANEKKYDFAKHYETSDGIQTNYYRVETYRLNLKTAKYSQIAFGYVVNDSNSEFNNQTSLLYAQKIDNKTLSTSKLLLLNDILQVKEIDYEIDTISKINKDRYLVENSYGYYLIDSNYEQICFLGKHDELFTTKESVILTNYDTEYTYICDLNGTIIKKYKTDTDSDIFPVTNIYDDKYYMVEVETTKNDSTYTEKYLERLGIRQDKPIYSIENTQSEYTYNEETYVGYIELFEERANIITRVKRESDGDYTYELYNTDGDLLCTLENFQTADKELEILYSDDDYAILRIATNKANIEYTLLVDR